MTILKPGFPDVPENGRIDTLKFIEACETIPPFFDIVGGKVFKPVKSDVANNIKKIKDRYLKAPDKFATLEDIIDYEKTETDPKLKCADKNGIATNALMWLKRGLKFILEFLERFLKGDYDANKDNLKACASSAYKASLEPYHNWIVKQTVLLATNACPTREKFIEALANEESVANEQVVSHAEEFVINFRANVEAVYKMYETKGVEKPDKV